MKEKEPRDIRTYPIAFQYDLELYGSMGGTATFTKWLEVIRESTEYDTIRIHINSIGGELLPALQLAFTLRNCLAHVETVIEGECLSAATIIFLSGDSFTLNPSCRFMVHTYSGGMYGKGHELVTQAQFDDQWSKDQLNAVYKDFLSDGEIKYVLAGGDIYLNAEQLRTRCASLLEKRKAAVEAPEQGEQGNK